MNRFAKTLALTIPVLGMTPAMAQSLAHPDIDVVKACVVDIGAGPEMAGQRIVDLGWAETQLTQNIQSLGRELMVLQRFELNTEDRQTSLEQWNANISAVEDDLGDIPVFGYSNPAFPVITRVFADPDKAGFAILQIDDAPAWSCTFLWTRTPSEAHAFMTEPPEVVSYATDDGLTYVYDANLPGAFAEILGLIPFLPTPKNHYASSVLVDPQIIRTRYGHDIALTFAVEIGVDSAI